jgi:thioredoxin-related protein
MNQTQPWAIKTLVPEEVYTDRTDFLDYFKKAALKAKTRRTMSTVLLGQRRMGKTEIFKRVVNQQHELVEMIHQNVNMSQIFKSSLKLSKY